MKKIFTPLLTTALCLATVPAMAQTEVETMNVHHKDGTTTTLNLSTIKDVTFGNEEPAASQLNLTGTMHEYWGEVTANPADEEITYNMMWLEKSEYDRLYPTPEDAVKDDLLYYQQLADGWGMTLEDILSYYLMNGSWTNYMGGTDDMGTLVVEPGKQYIVWAYGLNSKGEMTTPFESITLNSPAIQTITEKPVIKEASANGTSIKVTVTPDNTDRRYITYCLPKSAATNADDLVTKAQTAYVNTLIEYMINGYTIDDVLTSFSWNGGEHEATFSSQDMKPETDYYVMTAYINDAFTIISPIEWQVVKTGSASTASAPATPSKAAFVDKGLQPVAKAPTVHTTVKRGLMKRVNLPLR